MSFYIRGAGEHLNNYEINQISKIISVVQWNYEIDVLF